jgi:hypothetical protein
MRVNALDDFSKGPFTEDLLILIELVASQLLGVVLLQALPDERAELQLPQEIFGVKLVINEENALVPLADFDLDCPLINAVIPLKGKFLRVRATLTLLILRIDCFIIQWLKFLDRYVTNREHNDEGYLVQGLCLVYE